jgi:transposase-like protein
MDHHLGGEAAEGRSNSRNGYGRKTVLTGTGKLPIAVPRDRLSTFEPQLIAKYRRRLPGFDNKIVSMYARGMTVREIQGHLAELYGIDVSPDLISSVTDAILIAVVDSLKGFPEAITAVFPQAQVQTCIVHTIRTQSTVRLGEAPTPRRWTVQRDDMADLQAALVHDDALDDELQNRLSVGKARLPEAAAHTLAEGGQVAQHRLRFDLLAA